MRHYDTGTNTLGGIENVCSIRTTNGNILHSYRSLCRIYLKFSFGARIGRGPLLFSVSSNNAVLVGQVLNALRTIKEILKYCFHRILSRRKVP